MSIQTGFKMWDKINYTRVSKLHLITTLGRVRGVRECGGLLLKMSRRVGGQRWGQGEAMRRAKTPKTLTFEPLAVFKKSESRGVHGCEGLPKEGFRRIGGQGEGQLPPPQC